MASLVVECRSRRYTVKTTPTMTLSAVLQEVCSRHKPPLEAKACLLVHGNLPLDPSISVRFANVPSGTKLKLVEEAPGPKSIGGASPQGPSLLQRAKVGEGAKSAEMASREGQNRGTLPSSKRDINVAAGDTIPETSTVAHACSSERQSTCSRNGREIYVFDIDSMANMQQIGQDDIPDDFYDFTVEDYHRVMSGYAATRQELERGFTTRAMREAEEQQKAAAMGPVHIKFQFSDGVIVRSTFWASELVEDLYSFLRDQVQEVYRGKLNLLTAPPPQVLKDRKKTLLQAQLVPAAKVYVTDSQNPLEGCSVLRPEVLELQGNPPTQELKERTETTSQSRMAGKEQQQKAAGQFSNRSISGPRPAKVPKWMKLGK